MKIVAQRYKEGWYCAGEEPEAPGILTMGDAEKLPEKYRTMAKEDLRIYQKRMKEWESELKLEELAKKVASREADLEDAIRVAEQRRYHQYEGYELVYLEES